MADPRMTPPSIAPPRMPNVAKRNRVVGWLRYRSWTVVVGVLLLLMGLVNLYPFVWMAGTSLKSKSEAATERIRITPRQKYELADALRADVRQQISEEQAGAWADAFKTYVRSMNSGDPLDERIEANVTAVADWLQNFTNDTDKSAPRDGEHGLSDEQVQAITGWIVHDGASAIPGGFDERQVRAILELTKPAPEADSITPTGYSALLQCDLQTAAIELRDLHQRGLVEAVRDGERFVATKKAHGEIHDDLNARQVLILIGRRHEDLANRQTRAVFVPDRISAPDYAENFGIRAETAEQELEELSTLGFMQPITWQWENYKTVLFDPATRFDLRFLTSLAITISVVFLTVLMSSMFGYALARLKFPGKMFVLCLLLAGAVAPREAIIIPIFRMLQALGLIENLWGVVLWLSGVAIGNSILMAGFFLTLPKEVEEVRPQELHTRNLFVKGSSDAHKRFFVNCFHLYPTSCKEVHKPRHCLLHSLEVIKYRPAKR